METVKWLVAEEHDDQAFEQLGRALKSLGAVLSEKTWGCAGSQELSEWRVSVPYGCVVVSAETYMGLSVAGPVTAVDQVRQAYGPMAAD